MFWKHPKVKTWILCLLSSILLCTGYTAYVTDFLQISYPVETTAPAPNTSWNSTPTIELQETMPVRGTEITGSPIVADPVPKSPFDRSVAPYLRACCIFLGIILGLAFLFTRQETPLLGPEWDIAGLAVSFLVLRHLKWFYPSFPSVLFCLGIFAWLLLSLRELIWWISAHHPLGWGSFHRLARATGRWGGKQLYLLTHMVLSILAMLMIVKLCGELAGYRLALLLCPLIMSLLLSWLSLWQLGEDIDHLAKQIENVHQGEPVDSSSESFKTEETKLSGLKDQIDEAVKTAVTGERFKVELISNVSHDLRTPLTAILGYGELLEKESLSEEGRQQLDQLNRKAGYMRELVDTVFELTKVSSGTLEPKYETIDLIRLLEQTIGLYDEELKAANLQVRRHYDSEQLPIVTDGSRMHQVFANLLGNALKYALQGTRIHLHVTQTDILCTVRMTNIAAYEMDFQPEEILQRFARGDKARTTKGSGIGLAIAQTYTQSVGGSFRVSIDAEQFSAIVELPKL